jgi:hypothetical protein
LRNYYIAKILATPQQNSRKNAQLQYGLLEEDALNKWL